jgi:hypothetical protein
MSKKITISIFALFLSVQCFGNTWNKMKKYDENYLLFFFKGFEEAASLTSSGLFVGMHREKLLPTHNEEKLVILLTNFVDFGVCRKYIKNMDKRFWNFIEYREDLHDIPLLIAYVEFNRDWSNRNVELTEK